VTRWYVVHTQAQAEEKALWHLTKQGLYCFLPRLLRLRSHARRVAPVRVPLFPQYLFARLNLDETRWRAINGTRGVVSLLANGPNPIPVPRGLIETLVAKCAPGDVISLAALGAITKGSKVRVKGGAFDGQVGEITEPFAAGRDRVRILFTLLGAETEIQLPSYAIEAA
jgi:transcriptional antiterminator RfaH